MQYTNHCLFSLFYSSLFYFIYKLNIINIKIDLNLDIVVPKVLIQFLFAAQMNMAQPLKLKLNANGLINANILRKMF